MFAVSLSLRLIPESLQSIERFTKPFHTSRKLLSGFDRQALGIFRVGQEPQYHCVAFLGIGAGAFGGVPVSVLVHERSKVGGSQAGLQLDFQKLGLSMMEGRPHSCK